MAKPNTAGRGNTYILTATGKKHLKDISGQGALVRDCVSKYGPITSAGILERIGKAVNKDLKVAAKNIAFHLCIWKGDGFVKFGKKAAAKNGGKKAE